jgi:1-acyl-sn-glycerol-3-phosphate acyltransferase
MVDGRADEFADTPVTNARSPINMTDMPNMTPLFPDEEVLLDRVVPMGTLKESHAPVYKTMLYTVDISARFLLAGLVGKGTVAYCDELLHSYWTRIFKSGNARVLRRGAHHFEAGQPYVVMTNHSSLLDIPALMAAIPGSMRMVMKEEIKRVPLWGHALVASGFIPVDRKNREKAIAQLQRAKEMLNKGVSVWISPEGTRARDGKLAPFKKGGFHIAMDLGIPIIPGWIEGAQEIIRPDQFGVVPDGQVRITFGKPIATAGRSKEDLEALMTEVRTALVALSGKPDPLALKRAA